MATLHEHETVGRRTRRGVALAAGCLVAALLLNLPHTSPGWGDVRDIAVLALAVLGILAAVPAIWSLRRRVTKPVARAIVGVAAVLVWIGGAVAAMLFLLMASAPVGFMQSRTLVYTIQSRDGHVVFRGYRRHFWGPGGTPELAMNLGPFELTALQAEPRAEADFHRRMRDLRAWGHRLEWRADDDVRLDGEPAIVLWKE